MKDKKSAAKFHYIKTVSGRVVAQSIAFRVVSIYWQELAPYPWYLNAKGQTRIGSTCVAHMFRLIARQPWRHCVTSLRSAHWLASSLKLAARCFVSRCWPSCFIYWAPLLPTFAPCFDIWNQIHSTQLNQLSRTQVWTPLCWYLYNAYVKLRFSYFLHCQGGHEIVFHILFHPEDQNLSKKSVVTQIHSWKTKIIKMSSMNKNTNSETAKK